MTLISELIDIPTQVQDGDFVLKLTQGVNDNPTGTIDDYVVTEQLAKAFDEALGLVASAVADGKSKAAYIQGSFGSGKSHFMAMLHLLLSNDTQARAKRELHDVVSKWDTSLEGKRFLLVPVHFLDARSMEQKILGGYVDLVEKLHPGGALPAVFLGDAIVTAELPNLRKKLGEQGLLDGLNRSGDDGGGNEWGEFASTWTSELLDEALAAPATDPRRRDLVAAYVAAFRKATVLEAASTGKGFIDLDRGLAAISTHAAANGYDGVVLFLDELILWLASKIGDLNFVQDESQKLTNLTEGTAAGRQVPIISFVARQRDLRELVGDHIAGAEQRSFADNLELQQGRFSCIELASGNLPVVARQRLLKPVDDAANAVLVAALDGALSGREEIKQKLLGAEADIEVFRTVYPFSPALVQVLVDVSEALQRERTALKVMLQLLVDQRDTLELGQIVPVGDLWDVVASRAEPFSKELKKLFETAKTLWRTRLYPALVAANNVSETTPADARERRALANDARLLKTVLLAALVPESEALRGLDAARLAALNWGTISSPIPGQETQLVATKLRRLAAQVGELMIGADTTNPTVSIRLANVDTEDIISRAAESFDNHAARRQKVRTLIASATRDRIGADLRGTLKHLWRGTVRPVDVVFGNVGDFNEMADNALVASPDRPKLIVDFPFDEAGRSPAADLERLDDWSQRHDPTNTVCWLPSFFNTQGLAALKRYVTVDELLKADRFGDYTTHLSANQRNEAKPLLENIRSQLAAQLSEAILYAYGVGSTADPMVDPANSLTDHYRWLDPAFDIAATTRPTFDEALGEVCDQIFDTLYPGHPKFEATISPAQLGTTWVEIKRALADPDGRIRVENPHRKTLRNVANALGLGTMHESHFLLSDFWRNQLARHFNADGDAAAAANSPPTVEQMRAWIDEVQGGPRGLGAEVADLIILTVTAQTDHRLTLKGMAYTAAIAAGKAMPGEVSLVPEKLPSAAEWSAAVDRAAGVFGKTFQRRVTGPELASMATKIRTLASNLETKAADLVSELSTAYSRWGLAEGDRLSTARSSRDLVTGLQQAENSEIVRLLAEFDGSTSDAAAAKSLSSAGSVAASLKRANFELWDNARSVLQTQADAALTADEVVAAFEPEAVLIEARATTYVTSNMLAAAPAAAGPQPNPAAASGSESVSLQSTQDLETLVEQLRAALRDAGSVEVSWRRGLKK